MVVNDGNMVARLQKPKILDLLGAIRIHNDEKRLAVGNEQSLLRAYEHVFVLGAAAKELNERLCRAFLCVRDYVRLLAVFAGKAAHADSAADAVHIAEFMTHDEHARGVLYKRLERICHHS